MQPETVPSNLDEAIYELRRRLSPSDLAEFKAMNEDTGVASAHFNVGMWIRNTWLLGSGSPLAELFREKGVYHPDEMSSVILRALHKRLHDRSVRLDELIHDHVCGEGCIDPGQSS